MDYFVQPHEHFESAYNYMSFNDVGNFIGKIFRRFDLKYGEQGLVYVYRRQEGYYNRDLDVCTDPRKIFAFVGLDFEEWEAGFESLEQVFDWVTASPYFSVEPYKNPKGNLVKRAERTTIRKFLEYIDEKGIDTVYEYSERESYLPMVDAFFPEAKLLEKIENEKQRERHDNAIACKFNGHIVMELIPELEGPSLGKFIRQFQQHYNKPALHRMEPEAIRQAVLELWERST